MTAIPAPAPDTGPRHRRADRGGLRRSVLLVGLAAAVSIAAVLLSPATWRSAVAWCSSSALIVLTCVLAVGEYRMRLVRQDREEAFARLRRLEHELDQAHEACEALSGELRLVVEHVLPAAVDRLRERASASTVLAELDEQGVLPAEPAVRELVETAVRTLHQEHRRLTSAVTVLQDCAHRVHAAVTDQLADISARKRPYWDDAGPVSRQVVRADFDALDARLSQMGLLTQRLLTVTGARRTGRPWPRPVAVARVLRAAVGACEDYTRVRTALPHADTGLAAPAVNGAIHVLSELCDNALRFSPPTTAVSISAEEVPAGLVVHIDDSGLTMSEETLRRARQTVDFDHHELDITTLTGSRLGLPAARISGERFGIRIAFSASASGGTRASVLLPRQWLTHDPAAAPGWQASARNAPAGALAPQPAPALPRAPRRSAPSRPEPTASTSRLPRREPGLTLTDASSAAAPPAPRIPTADETQRRMGAFRRATRPTRSENPDDH